MAAPHVAGGGRAPAAAPSRLDGRAAQVGARPDRQAGDPSSGEAPVDARGRRADRPRRARTTPLHLRRADRRLVRPPAPGKSATRSVDADRRGRRRRPWTVSRRTADRRRRATITVPATVTRARAAATVAVTRRRSRGRRDGLRRPHARRPVTRRIPYWFHVVDPKLGARAARHADARPAPTRARPPAAPRSSPPTATRRSPTAPLGGPEQVFRVTVTQPVANFGVIGALGQPRLAARRRRRRREPPDRRPRPAARDQPVHRLLRRRAAGGRRDPAGAGHVRHRLRHGGAARGARSRSVSGSTTSRRRRCGWCRRSARRGGNLELDGDRRRLRRRPAVARRDDRRQGRGASLTRAAARSSACAPPAAGRHPLVFTASDYQELKNMENVPQILPNTRTFSAAFRVASS